MAKASVALIIGAIVAAVIWGAIYQQTHNQYSALNSTLDQYAGNYDSLRNQQSLNDNALLYSLLGGIIVGSLALVVMSKAVDPSTTDAAQRAATIPSTDKKCPFCAELIKPDAKICRYCGRDQPA